MHALYLEDLLATWVFLAKSLRGLEQEILGIVGRMVEVLSEEIIPVAGFAGFLHLKSVPQAWLDEVARCPAIVDAKFRGYPSPESM